jgi:hypothetical protein
MATVGIGQQVRIAELQEGSGHAIVRSSQSFAMDSTIRVCPLCQVKIQSSAIAAQEVCFSTGASGSRAKLWARVCQYVQDRGSCINSDAQLRSEPGPSDFYGEAPTINL